MYLTTIKIKREGDKPVNEHYLVEAVNLTDVETKITRDFGDVDFTVTSCKIINFVEVFEDGGGLFFDVKVRYTSIDDKKITELYLLEASDESTARERFSNEQIAGDIISFVEKPYMGIIR